MPQKLGFMDFVIIYHLSLSNLSCLILYRSNASQLVTLNLDSKPTSILCHMGDFGCGDGGWTPVMKIDGNKVCHWSAEYQCLFPIGCAQLSSSNQKLYKESIKVLSSSSGVKGTRFTSVYNFPAQYDPLRNQRISNFGFTKLRSCLIFSHFRS